MTSAELEMVLKSFRDRVSDSVALEPAGNGRFIVRSPFIFDDGDEIGLVLRRDGDRWVIADEGQTMMHLSYDISNKDIGSGNRAKIISNSLSMFGVQETDGELVLPVKGDQFGDSLYSIAQAILRIADVSYLTRERVRSTVSGAGCHEP